MNLREIADKEALAIELAGHIALLLESGLLRKGAASLVVSGGSTPVPLFDALAGKDLSWEKVLVTVADERWVAVTTKDSNEFLVRRHLLRDRAADAGFIGLKTEAPTAGEGETACAERLGRVPTPFDVVVLGMGKDGHTASLFPGALRLSQALDKACDRRCMAISPPGAPFERMTLTVPVLLNSRQIIVHITGAEKRRVLEEALGEGPVQEMPIRAILRQSAVPVSVWWAP